MMPMTPDAAMCGDPTDVSARRAFSEQRPLVCCALAYGAGILLASFIAYRPLVCLAGLVVSFLVLPLVKARRARLFALITAVFWLGLLYAGSRLHPQTPPEGSYRMTGYVSGESWINTSDRCAAILRDVDMVSQEDGTAYRAGKLYWSFYQDEDEPITLTDGKQISFVGTLYEPSPQMNPYGFDYRMYLLSSGMASGVSGCKEFEETGVGRVGFSGIMLRARQAIARHADTLFGDTAPMVKALLLGVRDELPEETREDFNRAGVSHILAVSGLHVALLAGLLMALLTLCRVPIKARFVCLAVFHVLYCAMLEFSAPVLRASVMMLAASYGRLRRLRRDGITLIAAAFLVILIARPLDLYSVGFRLSFCAVLGIYFLYGRFDKLLKFIRITKARAAVAVTFSAVLGTALPVATYFHRLSIIGLIVSPLVCALLPALLFLYLSALLCGALYPPLGALIAQPAIWLTKFMTWFTGVGASSPLTSINVPAPHVTWYIAAVVVLLSLSGLTLWRKRVKISLCAVSLIVAVTMTVVSLPRGVRYMQFSMGQEDAALLTDGRETVLIDVGEDGGDVVDYLLSRGLRADSVILTHLHADHCLGLRALMDADIPVGRVYLPVRAEEQQVDPECLLLMEEIEQAGIPILPCAAGDEIKTTNATITLTWPVDGKTRDGLDANIYAAALLIEAHGARLLVMSDTDGLYEKYAATPADILKVAHHGSAGSTSEAFLTAVSPSVAIISCSGSNRYLPSEAVLERLDRLVPTWYRTDQSGAVTITFDERGASVTPYIQPND